MLFGEPRDTGRYKGRDTKEREKEDSQARRVRQDGKGKVDVEQYRWTNQENGGKGARDHKGAKRDTKRSLRNVLEGDHKRPPGDVDGNKKRIFEDNGGKSSKELEHNAERKSDKNSKTAKEGDDVKPKNENSRKRQDDGPVGGRGKKNDASFSKKIHESNGAASNQKADSKDDGRVSRNGKKNDASLSKTKIPESNETSSEQKADSKDENVGGNGKKNDASLSKKINESNGTTSNQKADSKDDGRGKGKKNDASLSKTKICESNGVTSSNRKEGSKSAKLQDKNSDFSASKESSVVQPTPNLEDDFPELGKKQGSAKNIAKPSRKPTYDSEFPTLSNEPGKPNPSKPGPNVRPPPGLAPPGLGGELNKPSKQQSKQTNSFNSIVESGQKVEQGNDSYRATTKTKQVQGEIMNVEKSLVKKSTANTKSSVPNKPASKPTYDSEFPTLSMLANGNKAAMNAPPGLAPPGFQPGIQAGMRPPPGMGWTVPLNMPSAATSSTKDSRNQKLINDVRRILNFRGESFDSFRAVSGSYRQGSSSAETYYQQCCELLGEDHIHKVFRELIDLLPDEEKQKQLLMIYDARVKAKEGMRVDAVTFHMPEESSVQSNTEKAVDQSNNRSKPSLENMDFPALPKASGKKNKSAGKVPRSWPRGK